MGRMTETQKDVEGPRLGLSCFLPELRQSPASPQGLTEKAYPWVPTTFKPRTQPDPAGLPLQLTVTLLHPQGPHGIASAA